MPYYKELNILFIHIPKTGGSSVEKYLSEKCEETLKDNCKDYEKHKKFLNNGVSLQHQVYNTLYKFRNELNIDFNSNLKIISIIRNPYTRIISDLFYNKLIKKNENVDNVYLKIIEFITNSCLFDNHSIPQYKFITDENNKIIQNIKIYKLENLTRDLRKDGFNDFNICIRSQSNTAGTYINCNYNKQIQNNKINKYLNYDSIKLINAYYKKDFELFNYDMYN